MALTQQDKDEIADKLMSVNKILAETQARNPNENDKKGFGSAHWGLGLVLDQMWEDPGLRSLRPEIAAGAAHLLWRHRKQAGLHHVSEKQIKVFLPWGAETWAKDDKRWDRLEAKTRAMAAGRLSWVQTEPDNAIAMTAVGSDKKALRALREAASWCGVELGSQPGTQGRLFVPEDRIWRLMEFACTHTWFRGMILVGQKMPFDQLAIRYPQPAPARHAVPLPKPQAKVEQARPTSPPPAAPPIAQPLVQAVVAELPLWDRFLAFLQKLLHF